MHDQVLKLVEVYNQLDKFMERLLPTDHYTPFTRRVQMLAKSNSLISDYKEDLLLLADIRNILVHDFLDTQAPLLSPTPALIDRFSHIAALITSPPKALDTMAIKGKNIFSVRLEDNVLETVSVMNRKGYSHAPVLQDGKVIGVFSESSVFSYLTQRNEIPSTLTIGEIFDLLAMAKYKPERYRFVPPDCSVFSIGEIFKQAVVNGRRVAVVFITSDGTANGTLLGMITHVNTALYR
jgi:CBS domain-containing protein